jgi:non-ribosomal peptide synthetase component E (peptide arylation enzyme)
MARSGLRSALPVSPAYSAPIFPRVAFAAVRPSASSDADGDLKITGRLKEIINRGGEKISLV